MGSLVYHSSVEDNICSHYEIDVSSNLNWREQLKPME